MKLVTLFLIITTLFGCSSTGNKSKTQFQITDQFMIDSIDLSIDQKFISEITYHTETEINQIVSNRINSLLRKEGLLSSSKNSTTLKIELTYKRKFVGEDTLLSSDSLAYPHFDYKIEFLDGEKVLKTISMKNLEFNGGFLMNLKVISGSLRDKSDEFPFIESLSKSVFKTIKDVE